MNFNLFRTIGFLCFAALFVVACFSTGGDIAERAPVGTAGIVKCYEDEIAAPRLWVPGTPKRGVTWDCINVDDYIDTLSD